MCKKEMEEDTLLKINKTHGQWKTRNHNGLKGKSKLLGYLKCYSFLATYPIILADGGKPDFNVISSQVHAYGLKVSWASEHLLNYCFSHQDMLNNNKHYSTHPGSEKNTYLQKINYSFNSIYVCMFKVFVNLFHAFQTALLLVVFTTNFTIKIMQQCFHTPSICGTA